MNFISNNMPKKELWPPIIIMIFISLTSSHFLATLFSKNNFHLYYAIQITSFFAVYTFLFRKFSSSYVFIKKYSHLGCKYKSTIELHDYPSDEIINKIKNALRNNIKSIKTTDNKIEIITKISRNSFGEHISISLFKLEEGGFILETTSASLIKSTHDDFGKNKANILAIETEFKNRSE